MTRTELMHLLGQRASRSDEMADAYRLCLATALQVRARGCYVGPGEAERAVANGASAVVGARDAAHRARTELAAMRAEVPA